ncbi:hypothetical protein [Micromonospora noduli]|uniref:Uncharacterized protein n=1 Tax=Micromonospora noduli TaxID=709876 RepID=A0A328N9B7_9ACTN|nr:hypothetical protein [Micromonospora noduli]RAO04240.1 hypothetical protein LAH08_01588 [Micromonospora noduli]
MLSVVLAGVAGRLATLRVADTSNRYYLRKAVQYLTVVVLLFALALLWQPFARVPDSLQQPLHTACPSSTATAG